MEKTSKLIAYALIVYTLLLSGCTQKQQAEPVSQICLTGAHKKLAMQAAEECLSKMNFDIDKFDIEQGYILTRPLTGAQWFEFWRSDTVGSFNKAEANIQDIRRTVELNFGPLDGKLCINCTVILQRFNLPERQIASSSRAYGMFTKSSEREQQLNIDSTAAAWVDLGEDSALESKLLKRIGKQLSDLQEAK